MSSLVVYNVRIMAHYKLVWTSYAASKQLVIQVLVSLILFQNCLIVALRTHLVKRVLANYFLPLSVFFKLIFN